MFLRLLGCLFAGFIAFLVCLLIEIQIFGPSVAGGSGGGRATLVALGVAGAFAWAFWKWPVSKPRL
jgi:hypothetical protein